MTLELFRDDAYLQDAQGIVAGHTPEGGIILNASIFYPTGDGQPGDSGRLEWTSGNVVHAIAIATTLKSSGGDIVLVPAEPTALPPVGAALVQRLDWGRRHRHMRVHTALHLLSVVIPLPVTSCSIGAEKGRLEFATDGPLEDKAALEEALNLLIENDLTVSSEWITAEQLRSDKSIVKTLSARPPTEQEHVRLVRIGSQQSPVDLQPCAGTHVARTAEIGRIRIGRIEAKGTLNHRVTLHLD